jgi:envelope integrity protein B
MLFKNKARYFLVVAAAVSMSWATTAASQTISLASHMAVYDLKLAEVGEGGGVESARGRIVMEFDNSCTGNIVNQRMLVEIGNAGGGKVVSDYHLSTFEDIAGKTMRFSVSNAINGRIVKESDGVAEKTEEEEGRVTFSDGTTEPIALPKGVLFPTGHTYEILKAAQAGKNLLSAKVFDGNGVDGLQDSLTIIGKKSGKVSEIIEKSGMANVKSWSVQMSFFDLGAQTNEPDYEVRFRMHENGVGSDLYLKYQDFSMKGELVQLELKKPKDCN